MARAENKSLLTILGTADEQFVIPIYQRRYDWDKENVQKLLEDLDAFALTLGSNAIDYSHYYMGNIVTKRLPDGGAHSTLIRYAIVDGQQRLTTTLLILASLSELRKNNADVAESVPELGSYLSTSVSSRASEFEKMKIDRLEDGSVLQCILYGRELSEKQKETNIYKNYMQISRHLHVDKERSFRIYKGIRETLLIKISLDKNENENQIFETINSDGKPLDVADLIKNYIFFYEHTFNEPEETAKTLNHNYQQLIEMPIGRDRLDDFYRHYCCIKSESKSLPKRKTKEIYKIFKKVTGDEKVQTLGGVREVIKLVAEIAELWQSVHTTPENCLKGTYPDSALWVYSTIVRMSINSYFPMIVDMFNYFNPKKDQRIASDIYRIVAKTIAFGALSGMPEKNKTRAIPIALKTYLSERGAPNRSLADFEKWLEMSEGPYRIPTRGEMVSFSKTGSIYESEGGKYLSYLLLANELQASDNDTKINYSATQTIEHIVPQKFLEKWYPDKSSDQQRIIESRVHSLGNLTLLTGKQNIKLGNSGWSEKKAAFERDSFVTNKELGSVKNWDLDEIDKRTTRIIDNIVAFFK